mgnify:CR=1 FL=1
MGEFVVDVAQIVSLIFPMVIALAGWAAKRWVEQVVKEMRSDVEKRTQPIQATANGGFSLPDAIRILNKLDKNVDELKTDVAHLRGRFDQHMNEGGNNA